MPPSSRYIFIAIFGFFAEMKTILGMRGAALHQIPFAPPFVQTGVGAEMRR